MSRPAITVEDLGKSYRIGRREDRYPTFREALVGAVKSPLRRFRALAERGDGDDTFWALKDVSFEVQPGEVVGIIGRNGAGKSTLLKVLSRITEPTTGEVRLRGRVASLLEVGTGFHPELTGRENIYLNGSILGMRKAEIDRKFDEIVAFAEIAKFLDTPVKRYSSGMYVRLAFAVAAHLEPEILVVDEVLAVGDVEFQKKCLGKMREIARGHGRTVLFVSHNMQAVRSLCESGVYLDGGRVASVSKDVSQIISIYSNSTTNIKDCTWTRPRSPRRPALSINSIEVELQGQQPRPRLIVGIALESMEPHRNAFLAIDFFNPYGDWIMQAIPTVAPFIPSQPRSKSLRIEVELPPLIPGRYRLGVWVGSNFSETLDEIREALEFTITESPTPGRTVPHLESRGYVVPISRVLDHGWSGD